MVNVGEAVEEVFDLWLDRTSIVITNHEGTVQLTPTMTGADVALQWSSSNDSVASVDDNGLVMGLTTGTATITAEATCDDNTVSVTCDVIVLLSDVKAVMDITPIDNHQYLVTYSDGSSESIRIGNNYYDSGTTIEQTIVNGRDGKDGVGIVSIEKTGTIANADTYTITYTDGTTTTFTVTNGKDGKDGATPVITIGENGHWFINDVDTGKNAVVKESKVVTITVISSTALAVSLATLVYVVSKNRKLMAALLNK